MFLLKLIMKTIKVMGSETSPYSIAFAVVLGLIMAFNPFVSIQVMTCLVLLIFFKVNIGAWLFSFLTLKGVAILCSGLFDSIGTSLLESESLYGMWTSWYNSSLFSLTGFYNSVALGGMLCSVILVIPVFFGMLVFVKYYRNKLEPKIVNSKIAKAIKANKLYKMYKLMTTPIGGGGEA